MDGTQATALGIGAILVFWMLGAYNRLVRLRNRILTGWHQVDEQLARRRTALPLLLQALTEPLQDESVTLATVAEGLNRLNAASETMRSRPARAAAVAALTEADALLDAALSRLLALLDQRPALRERDDVAPLLRELHDADLRLAFARQWFDDAALAYNDAVSQLPTRLLTGMFGFEHAGMMQRRNDS